MREETFSLDKQIDEESLSLLEQLKSDIYDENYEIEKISWKEYLKEAFKKLPEKERKVIEFTLLQDRDMHKIAEEMKISLPHVYRLQKKGIMRMRGMLSKIRQEFKKR
jgi:RNA polymerase sporulation-specific sigma factor